MVLTKGQEQGLKTAVERYRNHEAYTVIAGPAGSGKSSLVRFIIDALDLPEDKVVNVAYTGKASLVLKNKGMSNCMTAHRLLYNAKEKPDGTYEFHPKTCLDNDYKLIVLDECSMLSEDMWNLLLSHKVHVIALGDNEQLPPISGNSCILEHPHVILDEVVRQALDNPIIRLSMDVRAGKWLDYGGPKECRVMKPEQVSDRLLLGANQILCGKNATRYFLNEQLRKLQYKDKYTEAPIEGDKIICLKNEWRTIGSDGNALVNGMIGTLSNIQLEDHILYKPKMIANFTSDIDGLYTDLHMDYKIFTQHETTVNKDNWKKYPKPSRPYEFDYAYAVTVHKFQGSEAERVIVYDEWLGDRDYHRRWLYTAITRSSKMVVIVR